MHRALFLNDIQTPLCNIALQQVPMGIAVVAPLMRISRGRHVSAGSVVNRFDRVQVLFFGQTNHFKVTSFKTETKDISAIYVEAPSPAARFP